MNAVRLCIALGTLAILVGCATSASKMAMLDLGMNREAVVAVMGEPHSASEIDEVLYLRYHLRSAGMFPEEYFVRLNGGVVDAYGRRGDFGLGY